MTDRERTVEALVGVAWPQVEQVETQRLQALVGEVRAIVTAARGAAGANTFEDEPARFGAVLNLLARPGEAADD